jgi:endonuclease III
MSDERLTAITDTLLEFGKTIPPEELLPTIIPQAAWIVAHDPYAFCISTCLDRGTKAEIIWTIPYDINNVLGHLDPFRIDKLHLDDLTKLFARLPRRPRYTNAAPRTLKELTRIVVEECAGDASRIWKGKHASEVKRTFESIYGVGPGIASMGILLIEKAFAVRFDDHWAMDIKPDVHTTRVLYRLGVSTEQTVVAALEASRRMNPAFPGIVDSALWEIGRRWCRPTNPDCMNCPISSGCAKRF